MRHFEARSDDGSVLVIAMILLTVMIAIGLSSFAFVDTGQKRAREQRERETSLNLTEAVLYSQGFALAQAWPGNVAGGTTMPSLCTSASMQTYCPNPNNLAAANSTAPAGANFTTVDALANVQWTTRVRDNGAPIRDAFVYGSADAAQTGTNVRTGLAYTCPGPCRWDANGDLMLWIQARAVVRGRPRNVVALVKREQYAEAFARNTLTAGSFETTNKGNKVIIDARGSQVVVRCTTTGPECTDYAASKNQVLPPTILRDPNAPLGMTATQLARFKSAAQTSNPSTYYTSCPTDFTGQVVYIDVPDTTDCTDVNNGATYNTATNPGIIIMPRGRLVDIKNRYYAIFYLGNQQNSSGPVMTLGDNAELFGGIAIDGPGRLVTGQSSGPRPTLTYLEHAFNVLASYGTTGLVQNTWRELPPT
jgi:Tfp pilus assembly protein PilX